jgi:hypothetical protein
MNAMYPLAIGNVASVTSLVRMMLYQRSIVVYHATVERNEGLAVSGGASRNAAAENPVGPLLNDIPGVRRKSDASGTAPCGAAARSDNQGPPCAFDGAGSDSERKVPR